MHRASAIISTRKIGGRKRHLLVDTFGLIWGFAVLPASSTDWNGAVEVMNRFGTGLPRLARVWADSAYHALSDWVSAHRTRTLEIVTRREGSVGFEVQRRRWVVERTFGWFGRYRRLSKEYEHNTQSSEARLDISATHRFGLSKETNSLRLADANITLSLLLYNYVFTLAQYPIAC